MSGDSSDTKRGKRLDLFCWKCHKTETNISCSRCERSFHNKCISVTKSLKDFAPNWVCHECHGCLDVTIDTKCPLDSIQLQQMLLLSLKSVSKSADYYFKSDKCFADKQIKVDTNLIANPMNLKKIEDKVNGFEYKCFGQMTSDFKWILHNCIVAQLESGLLENAKFILSKVKAEQKDFEECVHCFINYYKTSKTKYYSWFSKPCPQMHPLVWAKVRGHPYWPSKVIKANQQTVSVLVRFFGTQQTSWVKEKDCYLISEEIPKPLTGKALEMSKLLDSALEEMSYSIKYLNEEYPNWFRYSPKMTPFLIKDMISNNKANKTVVKDSPIPNRPIGWRPKARKTFPTPTTSSGHQLGTKPIETTFKASNDKKSKTKQNIEIIEFNSERQPLKRELNHSVVEYIDKRIKTDSIVKKEKETESKNSSQNFVYISQLKKSPIIEPINNGINYDIKKEIPIDEKLEACHQKTAKTDSESDLDKTVKCLQSRVNGLEKAMEIKDNTYKKQIMEMKQKSDLALEQMRSSLEIDKQRAQTEERNKQIAINNEKLNEVTKNFKTQTKQLIEKQKLEIKTLTEKFNKELNDCKTKIWCFSCLKEAQLYCCSHTYYCTNECQLSHWEQHKQICTQNKIS